MSQIDQLKQLVRTLLDDGRPHTLDEIKAAVQARHIVLPPQSSALRTAIYNLRKFDGYLERVAPGVYQRIDAGCGPAPGQPLTLNELRALPSRVEATKSSLQAFDWITCSDEELAAAREKAALLAKLGFFSPTPEP